MVYSPDRRIAHNNDTVDKARDASLDLASTREIERRNPIARFKVDGTNFSLGNLDTLDQRITPTLEPLPIPLIVQETLLSNEALEGTHHSARTYQNTIEQPHWEKELFTYIQDLVHGPAKHLAEELHIESLHALTPQQAIELSIRLVVDFTTYDEVEANNAIDSAANHIVNGMLSPADLMTTQQLLEASINNKQLGGDSPQAIGVCRNYASMVKAIFEALKTQQQPSNQLSNVYCMYENDSANGRYDPVRTSDEIYVDQKDPGHAWNSFVSITSDEAEVISVDATWAQRDLDTGKVNNVDHTLLRMEPMVNVLLGRMDIRDPAEAAEFTKGLMYYAVATESLQAPYGRKQLQWEHVTLRSLPFVANALLAGLPVPRKLAEATIKAAAQVEIISNDELQAAYTVAKHANDTRTIDRIIRKYITASGPPKHGGYYIVRSDELQRELVTRLREHDNEKFTGILDRDMELRIHLRDLGIEMTSAEFSPWSNRADRDELKLLLQESQIGRRLYERHWRFKLNSSRQFTEVEMNILAGEIRTTLKSLLPEVDHVAIDQLDDWNVLRKTQKFERMTTAR